MSGNSSKVVYFVETIEINIKSVLTYFRPMFHFYTPWKRYKTKGFLTFSGGTEIDHWTKMG